MFCGFIGAGGRSGRPFKGAQGPRGSGCSFKNKSYGGVWLLRARAVNRRAGSCWFETLLSTPRGRIAPGKVMQDCFFTVQKARSCRRKADNTTS